MCLFVCVSVCVCVTLTSFLFVYAGGVEGHKFWKNIWNAKVPANVNAFDMTSSTLHLDEVRGL